MPRKKSIKETEIFPKEQSIPQTLSVKKIKEVKEKVEKKTLSPEVYQYRYFVNTNKGGTIFIKDLKKPKMIEFDESSGKKIYKINVEECNQSSDLSHHVKLGNLIEITSSYIDYLEKDVQESFNIYSKLNPENKDPYVHVPDNNPNINTTINYQEINRKSKEASASNLLPTPEELSKIEGASDQQAHMNNVHKTSMTNAKEDNIMKLSVGDSNETSLVNPVSFADKSNHHQVDSRMYTQLEVKRPESAKTIQMRDINDPFFLDNQDFEAAQNQVNPSVQHVVNNDDNNPQLSKFIDGIINI